MKMVRAERQRKAVETIQEAGGWVLYDYQFDESDRFMLWAEPPAPDWLRELIGEDFFSNVRSVVGYGAKGDDEGMEHIAALVRLKALELSGSQVTDAGLENLKGLRRLRMLLLHGSNAHETTSLIWS